METIKLVTIGKKDINSLTLEKPIVYRAQSLISSMSYSGSIELIAKSTAFSDEFKKQLAKINGLISLGTTNAELRNAHIYSSNAKYLDGIERICHLQQDKNSLIVREYNGNRGAKYSSLYLVLKNKLNVAGFKEIGGKFTIDKKDIPKFVDIINSIIDERKKEDYELFIPKGKDSIDSVSLEKRRYYYYKAYWRPKPKDIEGITDAIGNSLPFSRAEDAIRKLTDFLRNCNDKEDLKNIREKINKIEKLILSRIKNIEELEELTSELLETP